MFKAPVLIVASLFSLFSSHLRAADIDAKNCELFVDKVVSAQGSHALRTLTLYVKVIPSKLNGDLSYVGFHRRTYDDPRAPGQFGDWYDETLLSASPVRDYWRISVPLSSDYGRSSYEGVLFAQTTKGDRYWFHSSKGNFHVDLNAYNQVLNVMGVRTNYDTSAAKAAPTQQEGLSYYNPGRCY